MSEVFEHAIVPAYYDFDASSVVHNTVYVRWLEDTRTAWQRTSPWPPERLYAADLVPALTRTEIEYKAPILLGDAVAVSLYVTRVGRSAWSVAFVFLHPGTRRVYARAAQDGCFVRRSTGRVAPMPADFTAFCRDYQSRTGPPPT